jgi:hypothetical protein
MKKLDNGGGNTILRQSRMAGFWYLMLAFGGAFSMLFVTSKLIIAGDPSATAAAIRGSELLFRFGIVAQLAGQAAFLMTGLAFYRLFSPVDKDLSRMLLIFVTTSVPITFLNAVFQFAALELIKAPAWLNVLVPAQLEALSLLSLDLNEKGIIIAGVFWGLWLLPLGLLVWKSDWFPKLFGILLLTGFATYLIDSLLVFLFPQIRATVQPWLSVLMSLGEIPFLLWLLIRGAREKKTP